MSELCGWSVVPGPPGQLYECARWIPEAHVFQWVDILQHSVHRWAPGADAVESRVLDLEFATAALPLNADEMLVSSRNSLHRYTWTTDVLSTIGSWTFAPDVRFNDGAVAPDGSLYIGTMSMERRRGQGNLFRLEQDNLVPIISSVGISNGLGWIDSDNAYYVDSLEAKISRISLVAESRMQTFVQLRAQEEPDGLAVAPNLDVLVAIWRGGKIIRTSPTGERFSDITLPAVSPTSVALGGPGRDLLLVTTARDDVADGPHDGRIFVRQFSECLQ